MKMKQLVLLFLLSLAPNSKQSSDNVNFISSLWNSTTTSASPTTTSGQICPLGWIDGDDLGCFLVAPHMTGLNWIEALEYCEEQVCAYFCLIGMIFSGWFLGRAQD